MTSLRLTEYLIPAADLGSENPLPPLTGGRDLHAVQNADPGIPDDMRRNMTYGGLPNILPYLMQDGYNREKKPRSLRAAVLENEILRATFLLELGGRLWSLYHKPSGRELLSVNPVFQPANLALRNAWFSGGVEWNIGTIGHSPFTCAPLHARSLRSADGTPMLRLYEWERIRQVTFCIDAWLPAGSPVLFVRVRIQNPCPCETPMYWWSNIAVPETPWTRVLVPAERAFHFDYNGLRIIPTPENEGTDYTYATRLQNAADFFFDIPEDRRPWITALDETGSGLFQVSTPRLRGRKLFVWGMARGGRKWQEFLSQPGQAYIEIQAGLARTQLEHLPMPANARWDWVEGYGLLEADPTRVHGADWEQAAAAAGAAIDAIVSRETLERELQREPVDEPGEVLQHGSGWGALEQIRRQKSGETPLPLPFDNESLESAQRPWLKLLETGHFPREGGSDLPPAPLIQSEWQKLLESDPDWRKNWLAQLQLGLMKYARGDSDGARTAWEWSLALHSNPWANRNLAVLYHQQQRDLLAGEYYLCALRLKPDLLPLAIETGQFLIETGASATWLELLPDLPPAVRQKGRIRLLEARAALEAGQIEHAGQLIAALPVIEDIREGELSLSQLWYDYQARIGQNNPLPAHFDFSMG